MCSDKTPGSVLQQDGRRVTDSQNRSTITTKHTGTADLSPARRGQSVLLSHHEQCSRLSLQTRAAATDTENRCGPSSTSSKNTEQNVWERGKARRPAHHGELHGFKDGQHVNLVQCSFRNFGTAGHSLLEPMRLLSGAPGPPVPAKPDEACCTRQNGVGRVGRRNEKANSSGNRQSTVRYLSTIQVQYLQAYSSRDIAHRQHSYMLTAQTLQSCTA